MRFLSLWLTSVVAFLVHSVSAAPVPVTQPPPKGAVSEALRLRGILPATAPLPVSPAVLIGDGLLEVERRAVSYVVKEVAEKVRTPDGKEVEVRRTTTEPVQRAEKVHLRASTCKFFTVTKEGTLEALAADKAMALLKKRTPVLTGDSSNIDPRTLELVKPGTLCVIFSAPDPTAPPPLLPPDRPRQ